MVVVAPAAPAAAQPAATPVKAGVQAAPPTAPVRPSLEQELDGRRAVRGCPVDRDCSARDVMREFEAAAFPEPGTDPWVDDRTAAPGTEAAAVKVTRPSQLRPDLPWLDELELPDMPVTWTTRLIDYLVFYRDDPHGHNIMAGWLEDQGRYRDLILTHLRKAGLPDDLLYVAMIESGYDPTDSSYAGAAGLWQFMPAGGRIYGMRIDRWVDERDDPLRSTIAVLDYFKDLYQRFGDWPLALAAFNAGYGAVLRSIARYNTNDYWTLSQIENGLPWSTTLYVPKALAAAICGHNRARMGFDHLTPAAPEQWEEVAVPGSITLAAIARAVGVPADELARLNPHLRRGRTPPGEAGYVVRVPRGTGPAFTRKLADLASDWDGFDAYVMAYGERFEDVATTFGISTSKLRKLNDITHESEVGGGSVLVVPRIDPAKREQNRQKAIAALHASGPDQKPGEPLVVAVPDKDATVDGKRRVFYRVIVGDTADLIAHALGVKASQLAAWNELSDTAELHPRMVLQAWVSPGFDPVKANVLLLDDARLLVVTRGSKEHLDLAEARVGRVRLEYSPTKSESLEAIGKKFGLGPRDLARINRMKSTAVIEPGQTIIVYKVVDRTRSDRAEAQWKKAPRDNRGTKGAGTKGAGPAKDKGSSPTSTAPAKATTAPAKAAAASAKTTAPAKAMIAPAKAARQPRVAGPVTSPSDLDREDGEDGEDGDREPAAAPRTRGSGKGDASTGDTHGARSRP